MPEIEDDTVSSTFIRARHFFGTSSVYLHINVPVIGLEYGTNLASIGDIFDCERIQHFIRL